MTVSVYGDISWRVGVASQVKALAHAEPRMVLQKFGMVQPVPKNKGQVIKWRRLVPWGDVIIGGAGNSLTGNITGWTPPLLTEGVTPASTALAYSFVQATLAQYGEFKTITDVIDDLAEDPVLQDQMLLAGERAAEVMELVTYNVLRAGTAVLYAGGASRATVAAPISSNLHRAVTRILSANRARKITSILGPSTNISTKPIEAAYIAFAHTDCDSDIRNMTGFVPVAQYGSRQPLCDEELGSTEDIRWITSSLFAPMINAGAAAGGTGLKSTGGANIDVYPIIFIGKEAFGCTPLKGQESMDIKVLNPNVPRGGDELGQRGSVGWKGYYVAERLNESWMLRVEAGVSNLPN